MVGGAARREAQVDMPRLWFGGLIDGRVDPVRGHVHDLGFIDQHPIWTGSVEDATGWQEAAEWREE